MRALVAALVLLAGCDRAPPQPEAPGAVLERAAVATGLVADPRASSIHGSWANESDRICIVPQSADARIGIVVDYGEGQHCSASGTVKRDGDRLKVQLGECHFEARFDGERITFPPGLPAACAAACRGRATLSALEVERLSTSRSEAVQVRDVRGHPLCGA